MQLKMPILPTLAVTVLFAVAAAPAATAQDAPDSSVEVAGTPRLYVATPSAPAATASCSRRSAPGFMGP